VPPSVRALGIFVKAPIPGRVKTRLAAAIGSADAATLYQRLGRRVVRAATGSGYRTTVWFTPAGRARRVREWLAGLGPIAFRPQRGAGLGARLIHAFAREFAAGAHRVVIVGSDCPQVDRQVIRTAFTALGSYDVVLGPALDGGYYLIGLSAPRPALFRAIAWSTTGVALETQGRAGALGLSCRVLRPLRDVDTVQDAHAMGLLNS